MPFQTISVIGLGYIGLPTAAVLASRQKYVVGVDINPLAVDTINRGEIHIVEPELDVLVHGAVSAGYLRATTTPEPADAFLICVPTPFKDDHAPDLSYVQAAATAIAPVLKPGNLVVLESTSPVGTTELLCGWLSAARPDLRFPDHSEPGRVVDINVAYCPERVLPGQVVRELVENDRAIGGISSSCSERAVSLYKLFVAGDCVVTNARTAEMAKLTENSFRDVNIAFANELSMICKTQGIDVWELIALANRHPRVNILQPGAGVGGHCIAVDPWFIVHSAPRLARLIRTAREVNDSKPEWVMAEVKCVLAALPASARVACLGLAFKPDIDDLRESPALAIATKLHAAGINVEAVEPNLEDGALELPFPLVSMEHGLTADVLVVLVKHRQFSDARQQFENHPRVVDAVGLLRR